LLRKEFCNLCPDYNTPIQPDVVTIYDTHRHHCSVVHLVFLNRLDRFPVHPDGVFFEHAAGAEGRQDGADCLFDHANPGVGQAAALPGVIKGRNLAFQQVIERPGIGIIFLFGRGEKSVAVDGPAVGAAPTASCG